MSSLKQHAIGGVAIGIIASRLANTGVQSVVGLSFAQMQTQAP